MVGVWKHQAANSGCCCFDFVGYCLRAYLVFFVFILICNTWFWASLNWCIPPVLHSIHLPSSCHFLSFIQDCCTTESRAYSILTIYLTAGGKPDRFEPSLSLLWQAKCDSGQETVCFLFFKVPPGNAQAIFFLLASFFAQILLPAFL